MSDAIHQAAQALKDDTIATRRDFHQHPEIAFEEVRTAGIIADKLRAMGLEPREGVGKTGIVATLNTGKPGKTVLLRADIDALPVPEEKDVPYRSQTSGKMHACGHDGHTAVLLSTAKILTDMKDDLSGKLVFVFQPAEEIVKGAEAMLADGALDGVTPDAAIGLHLSSMNPTGTVGVRSGPAMAAADAFRFVIKGKGGHAAMPHQTIDPIVAASSIVMNLQALVSRETDPVDQSVISITSLSGGTAFNIIPEAVELKGTLRTFDAGTRTRLTERVKAVVQGIASTLRCEVETEWISGSPAVVNNDAMTLRFREVASSVASVIDMPQMMGGDDMALWLNEAPGCYFFVGASNPDKGADFPHHHPRFDIDEEALPIAVELLTRGTLEYLQ